MAYIAVEQLLSKTENSVYKLVVLAARRALELSEGQPKLTEQLGLTVKPSIIALQEIMEGKVWPKLK